MENNITHPNPVHICQNFLKSGKIQCLALDTPSFNIDVAVFKHYLLDTVEEEIRNIKNEDGSYDSNLLSTLTDPKHPEYSSKAQEISKKAHISAFSNTAKSEFDKLSSDSESVALSTTFDKIGHLHDKSKFAATLLILKEGFSDKNYFKRTLGNLDLHQDAVLLKEIKSMVANPPVDVITHIHKIDPKMVAEKFPQQCVKILNLEKAIDFSSPKIR